MTALADEVRRRTERTAHPRQQRRRRPGASRSRPSPGRAGTACMSVNVTGLFTLTRELMPMLRRRRDGRTGPRPSINLGSVMGTVTQSETAYSYSASKAAVHHLTRILAAEFAARQVTVNAIAPGPFPTNMTRFAIGDEAGAARGVEGRADAPRRPAGRHGGDAAVPHRPRRAPTRPARSCRSTAASASPRRRRCSARSRDVGAERIAEMSIEELAARVGGEPFVSRWFVDRPARHRRLRRGDGGSAVHPVDPESGARDAVRRHDRARVPHACRCCRRWPTTPCRRSTASRWASTTASSASALSPRSAPARACAGASSSPQRRVVLRGNG